MPEMDPQHHRSHRGAATDSNTRQQTSDLASSSGENEKTRNGREKK
ncbi:MAG: hypothetical protein QM760_06280 [Nibricoccus sp.]